MKGQNSTTLVRSGVRLTTRVARLNTSKFSPTRSVAPRRFPARNAPHHHRAKTAPPRRLDTSVASGRLESPSTKGAARAKVSHGTPTMWSLASSVTRVGTVVASGRAAARRRAQAVAAGSRCVSVASAGGSARGDASRRVARAANGVAASATAEVAADASQGAAGSGATGAVSKPPPLTLGNLRRPYPLRRWVFRFPRFHIRDCLDSLHPSEYSKTTTEIQ